MFGLNFFTLDYLVPDAEGKDFLEEEYGGMNFAPSLLSERIDCYFCVPDVKKFIIYF